MNIKSMIVAICAVIVLLVIVSLWGFYNGIRPPHKIISTITPATHGIKFERIQFKTRDGVLIRGWYVPSVRKTNKTIILLHGYPADKGDIFPSRYFLQQQFNLLFIDFRYHGESEGAYTTVGKKEVLDLLAAVKYLKEHGTKEIGVWGVSLGGAVALMGAEKEPEIKVVVASASYARLSMLLDSYYQTPFFRHPLVWLTRWWGRLFLEVDVNTVSPIDAVAALHIPILIIHSRADEQISFVHAQMLEVALEHNPRAEFLFVDDARHGEISEQERDRIFNFFNKNL